MVFRSLQRWFHSCSGHFIRRAARSCRLLIVTYFCVTHQLSFASGNYESALSKLGSAYYKYSGLDDVIEDFGERNTPEFLKNNGAPLLVIVKLVADKQITYTWRFP